MKVISETNLLGSLPDGLRNPLLAEYRRLIQNFMEKRWTSAELSAGKICEIVYSIIKGFADGSYAASPFKPTNMVLACRQLEQISSLPRSLQILIPRILPALYEIRNNRGVGHVGGDVDPNSVDANLTISMVNWIMAELIRVFHTTTLEDAQKAVNCLAERRVPLIWIDKGRRKVLEKRMALKDQMLVLVASVDGAVAINDLFNWTEASNIGYVRRLASQLHEDRLVHYEISTGEVVLLPPGSAKVSSIIEQYV